MKDNALQIALLNFIRAEIDNRDLGTLAERWELIEQGLRKLIREEMAACNVTAIRDAVD